jgi:hypothetical protein
VKEIYKMSCKQFCFAKAWVVHAGMMVCFTMTLHHCLVICDTICKTSGHAVESVMCHSLHKKSLLTLVSPWNLIIDILPGRTCVIIICFRRVVDTVNCLEYGGWRGKSSVPKVHPWTTANSNITRIHDTQQCCLHMKLTLIYGYWTKCCMWVTKVTCGDNY